MKYSQSQAEKLARQIRDRFGLKISEACAGTSVPPFFVAGLIGVEAGKDRNGQLKETATRFEPGVFAKLKAVRAGSRREWSGVKTSHIRDATDASLRALATSYGLTQVMGWHCINNLNCSVGELKDPATHLGFAVQLMELNARGGDFLRKEYVGEFKEWNSGSETGRTHDPDYVFNAGRVMDAYRDLLGVPLVPEPVAEVEPEPAEPADTVVNIEHAEEVNAPGAQPVLGGGANDTPVQASQGGKKSLWATITGGAGAGLTAVAGWSQSNTILVVVGIICLTVLLFALIFRQVIMDYFRLHYLSDPARINVK